MNFVKCTHERSTSSVDFVGLKSIYGSSISAEIAKILIQIGTKTNKAVFSLRKAWSWSIVALSLLFDN